MRSIVISCVAACLVACGSTETTLGNGHKPATDAGLSSGGAAGCSVDTQCKGTRVCTNGRCIEPAVTGGNGTGGSGTGGSGTGGRDGTGGNGTGGNGTGGSGTGGSGTGGSGTGGNGTGGSGTGGLPSTGGRSADASADGSAGTDAGACVGVSTKPETVIVYRDATVTDTVYTSKPVALFFMVDRSSSMVTGVPTGTSAQSWSNLTTGITAFVNDPSSAGVDIGLGTFPYGPNNTADCAGSDCGTPVVAIAPLPQNGAAMLQAMQAQTPNTGIAATPTECGLRGMVNECLQYMAGSQTGEQCVAILVTDGAPTLCDTSSSDLTAIVADGHSKGVTTYALGLAGADLNLLDQFASAGGTNAAIDVSAGAQAVITALNNIRSSVAVTTVTHVTTQVTIASPVPCEWGIPFLSGGVDFDHVNLVWEGLKGVRTTLSYVQSASDCANFPADTWYFDNPQFPTKVRLCPTTCARVKNAPGTSISLELGCARLPAQ